MAARHPEIHTPREYPPANIPTTTVEEQLFKVPLQIIDVAYCLLYGSARCFLELVVIYFRTIIAVIRILVPVVHLVLAAILLGLYEISKNTVGRWLLLLEDRLPQRALDAEDSREAVVDD
ncbi:hypothetical protein F5X99DRAFT_408373 [Biscogniauxia marginata]|nr:hypothetical protein F5X99DRAFT_408373 [Biscogniauxia marginata]